ncbi:hypothetical protein ACL02S_20795 [Nocardia sp. 004]|uniref:hypothetical protein n=1 Tax=Nocardia sp. 004 TaxID=3385978 RepID=UPI0039A3D049
MVSDNRAGAVVARLVAEGVLSGSQADAVVTALAADRAAESPRGKVLAEIAAYLGAGLLFGGIVMVMASSWGRLGALVQVGILVAVAAGLLYGGVILAGGIPLLFSGPGVSRSARTRLATVLFALASVAAAGATGTAIDNGSAGNAWVFACLAGAVVAVLGYLALPSLLGLLACACFVPAASIGLLVEVFGLGDVWGSVAALLLGGLWFALAWFGVLIETWAGYLIAIVTSIAGAQSIGINGSAGAYLLTAVVAAACFGLYATQRWAVLVIGGAVAIALAAGQAVSEWTDDTLGVAGVVVALGATLLFIAAIHLTRTG